MRKLTTLKGMGKQIAGSGKPSQFKVESELEYRNVAVDLCQDNEYEIK